MTHRNDRVEHTELSNRKKLGFVGIVVATGLAATAFSNVLEGVLIGLATAVASALWWIVRTKIHASPTGDNKWHVGIEGFCTFLALPRLTRVLASVPPGTEVTVELSSDFLGQGAHEALTDWQRQHLASGGTVHIHDLDAVELDSALTKAPGGAFNTTDKRSGVVPRYHPPNQDSACPACRASRSSRSGLRSGSPPVSPRSAGCDLAADCY